MALLKKIDQIGGIVDLAYNFLPGATFDFSIRVLGTGGLGGFTNFAKTLVLNGRNAPLQPMEFGINTNLNKTNYPGNPVCSAQVLTTNKMPLRIQGQWEDSQSGGLTATYLQKQIDRIWKSGQALSIEWGPFAKTAVISEAVFRAYRHDLMDYEITFEVLSDYGDGDFEIDFKKPIRTVLGILSKLSDDFSAITSVFNAIPGGFGDGVLNQISNPMNSVTATASRVFG